MKIKHIIILTIQVTIVLCSVGWTLLSLAELLFPEYWGKGYIGGISGILAHFAARWIVKPIKS